MKLPVAVAREVALALNTAADRAMDDGAHEFEFDNLILQTSAEVRWPELVTALTAAGVEKRGS